MLLFFISDGFTSSFISDGFTSSEAVTMSHYVTINSNG